MTKDDATKIARRILDRVEQDRALHLDSLVEEIMAGFALVEPMGTKRVSASEASKIWDDRVRKNNDTEHDAKVRRMYEMLQHQAAAAERQRTLDRWAKQFHGGVSLAQGGGIGLGGGSVTHHESDPISGYRATLLTLKQPPPAEECPDNGFSAEFAKERGWSAADMANAGYYMDNRINCWLVAPDY